MKKLFFLLCVCAIVFTSCDETQFSDETAALAGKYKGTFTLIRQNADSTQSEAKEKTIVFKQNPLSMDNLLLEAVFEMIRTREGVYELDENNMTTALLERAIGYFNVEQYLGTTIESIEKISAKAIFSSDRVELKFYYNITLYGAEAEVVIATFVGTKL
jgi:hypothetical protein